MKVAEQEDCCVVGYNYEKHLAIVLDLNILPRRTSNTEHKKAEDDEDVLFFILLRGGE